MAPHTQMPHAVSTQHTLTFLSKQSGDSNQLCHKQLLPHIPHSAYQGLGLEGSETDLQDIVIIFS